MIYAGLIVLLVLFVFGVAYYIFHSRNIEKEGDYILIGMEHINKKK